MKSSSIGLALIGALWGSQSYSETQPPRPTFSESYSVSDAQEAYDEIDRRWDVSQAEQQARFAAFDGDPTNFKRSDPILQRVAWPFEECTDVISLIPPPMDGWGISSEASNIQNPVSAERAEVTYVRFDPELSSDDPDFYQTEEYVIVRVGWSVESKQLFDMMYAEEAMRTMMFEPGPFNYPIMKQTEGAILGDLSVGVSSTSPEVQNEYLTTILACAIKSGLASDLIDPADLLPVE